MNLIVMVSKLICHVINYSIVMSYVKLDEEVGNNLDIDETIKVYTEEEEKEQKEVEPTNDVKKEEVEEVVTEEEEVMKDLDKMQVQPTVVPTPAVAAAPAVPIASSTRAATVAANNTAAVPVIVPVPAVVPAVVPVPAPAPVPAAPASKARQPLKHSFTMSSASAAINNNPAPAPVAPTSLPTPTPTAAPTAAPVSRSKSQGQTASSMSVNVNTAVTPATATVAELYQQINTVLPPNNFNSPTVGANDSPSDGIFSPNVKILTNKPVKRNASRTNSNLADSADPAITVIRSNSLTENSTDAAFTPVLSNNNNNMENYPVTPGSVPTVSSITGVPVTYRSSYQYSDSINNILTSCNDAK